jgi:hypothetical protein
MAAMGADNLCRYLIQSMPLKDIAGRNNPGEPVRRTTAGLSSGNDDDGLVLKGVAKLESLVLEGLKIQIQIITEQPATAAVDRRLERDEAVGKGCCRVHAVLMQARDPTERYAAVGDPIIGLIEASLERKDASMPRRGCWCRGYMSPGSNSWTGIIPVMAEADAGCGVHI